MTDEYDAIKEYLNKYVTIIKKVNGKEFFYNGKVTNVIQGDSSVIIFLDDDKINDIIMLNCESVAIIPRGGEFETRETFRN